MEWFYRISHPFMSLPKLGEPPIHPPVVHDDTYIIPNPPVLLVRSAFMPQQPTPATVDVDMPRHAMV